LNGPKEVPNMKEEEEIEETEMEVVMVVVDEMI